MKIVITLDIDEFYKDEILNNVIRLDFICADKTVIERDEFTLKPMPTKKEIYERIYQAYGHGNDEIYQRIRQAVEDIYDEILGEE